MGPDDLIIHITADDDTSDEFNRLLSRLTQLERATQEFNREVQRTATAQTQQQTQILRGQDREAQRAHAEQLERLRQEGRERANQQRREASEEQDIRRARIRAQQEDRRRQERVEREEARRRRAELVHQQVLRREMERTRQAQLRSLGGQLGRGDFLGIAGGVADATLAIEGLGFAIAAVGSRIVTAASDFDRLNRGLTAITGSAAAARSQLEGIQELARLPGISFADASRTALRLRASGFDEERTNRLIREFGNAAQVSGATFADAAEALRQLTQIQSTGRFTAENLNQILERLPILRPVLLQEFGTTVGGDIQTLLESQGRTFDDAVESILAGLERQGRVDADSFSNAASNLGNDLNALARTIGGGLLPIARDLVNGLAALTRFFTGDIGQGILAIGTAAGAFRGLAGLASASRGFIGRRYGVGAVAGEAAIEGLAVAASLGAPAFFQNVGSAFGYQAGLNPILQRMRARGGFQANQAAGITTANRVAFAELLFGGQQITQETLSAVTDARTAIYMQQNPNATGQLPVFQGFRPGFERAERSATLFGANRLFGGRVFPLAAAGVGSLAGPAGLIAGGVGVGIPFWIQSIRAAREAARINEEAARISQEQGNFVENVFGGDEGIGQLRQFNEQLTALRSNLLRFATRDADVARERILPFFRAGEEEGTRAEQLEFERRTVPATTGDQIVNLISNLGVRPLRDLGQVERQQLLSRISAEQAQGLLDQIRATQTGGAAISARQRTELGELRATIARLEHEIRRDQLQLENELAVRIEGDARGARVFRPPGREEIEERIEERREELRLARENLQILEPRIREQLRLNEALDENADITENLSEILEGLGDIANQETDRLIRVQAIITGYTADLTRAQTQLGNVLFSLERADTEQEINAGLERQIQAILRVANTEADIARSSIENAEQRSAALEAINASSQQQVIRAQEAAAAQIEQIRDAAAREQERRDAEERRRLQEQARLYQESLTHVNALIDAHDRLRVSIGAVYDTVPDRAIQETYEFLDGAVDSLLNGFDQLNNIIPSVWNALISGAQRAGEEVTRTAEAFSILQNLGGGIALEGQGRVARDFGPEIVDGERRRPIRAGLQRDPEVADRALRRRVELQRNDLLEAGRRITEAQRAIGDTGRREPFDAAIPLPEPETPQVDQAAIQRRQQVQQFFERLGDQTYRRFGQDILLDALGLGGRGRNALNDALEDARVQFQRLQADITQDATLSETQRQESLREIYVSYIRQRRELERRAEVERSRAWRDYVNQVVADTGRLIYQQAQLRLAERATDFVFDNVLGEIPFLSRLLGSGGGGQAAGQAAGYAAPIGPGLPGAPELASAAGTGVSAGSVATAGVTLAGIAVAVNGLIDPITDVGNEIGSWFGGGGGGAPAAPGNPVVREAVRDVQVEAGQPPVNVNLNLNDRTLQEVAVRSDTITRQGRA